jgi:hypothetical protein
MSGYSYLLFAKIIKRFVRRPKLDSQADNKIATQLEKYNINLDATIRDFLAAKKAYKIILFFRKPEAVIIQDGYSLRHRALITAAKEMDIKTIEMQHGILSQYHPGYIIGADKVPDDFIKRHITDLILVFGKPTKVLLGSNSYWKDDEIITFGNAVLSEYRGKLNDQKEIKRLKNKYLGEKSLNKKIILVTSQGVKREKCREFVLNFSDKLNNNYLIIYKPHPIESDYKNFYRLFDASKNIIVVSNDSFLYDLLLISNIHTSYYSTCIYETIEFGITNILIEDEDSRNIADIRKLSGIYFVKTVSEYVKLLEGNLGHTKPGYYYKQGTGELGDL